MPGFYQNEIATYLQSIEADYFGTVLLREPFNVATKSAGWTGTTTGWVALDCSGYVNSQTKYLVLETELNPNSGPHYLNVQFREQTGILNGRVFQVFTDATYAVRVRQRFVIDVTISPILEYNLTYNAGFAGTWNLYIVGMVLR